MSEQDLKTCENFEIDLDAIEISENSENQIDD